MTKPFLRMTKKILFDDDLMVHVTKVSLPSPHLSRRETLEDDDNNQRSRARHLPPPAATDFLPLEGHGVRRRPIIKTKLLTGSIRALLLSASSASSNKNINPLICCLH
jgi:hypothetical protein